MKTYKELGAELGNLVDEKNKAYGSSFAVCGDFLKLIYPTGIKSEQYTDALLLVRIFDKMMRIANKKDAFGENPFGDIAGYGLLGLSKDSADTENGKERDLL
jgi:hypothetical protein